MAKTKKRALYAVAEGSFGVDPSAAGVGYLQMFTTSIGMPGDGKDTLETEYFTGRNFPTAPIAGPDGGSFDFETVLYGMATAAGNGVNASTVTDDVLDRLFTHIMGTQGTSLGQTVGVGSTTTNLVMGVDNFGLMDILPIWQATLPTAGTQRSQLAYITVDPATGSYTVSPALAAAPANTAVAYGVKRYTASDNGGASLAFAYIEDDVTYTFTGARIKSASITVAARKIIKMKCSVEYDSALAGAKGSLPAITAAPPVTPLIGILSPFYFNGVQYAAPSVTIDLGVTSAVQEATEGVNGRGNNDNIMIVPTVTVQPLRTDAIRQLKRDATPGRLVVQMGAGNFAGGIENIMAFALESAVSRKSDSTDESGRIRSDVMFKVADTVALSGVATRVAQLIRG
jgi:hypothetical protein